MGDWIWCKNCENLVPHYEKCDVCNYTLPTEECDYNNNTKKFLYLCYVCNKPINKKINYEEGYSLCLECRNIWGNI